MLIKASEKDRMRLLSYCKQEPNLNIFLIGDIETHGFDTAYQEVWYLENEDSLEGILLRYHDNLILYSHCHAITYEVIQPLLSSLSINVISGKADLIAPIYAQLSTTFGKRELAFCELTDGSALLPLSPSVQTATEADADRISEAYGLIAEFAGLYSNDPAVRAQQIRNRIHSQEGVHLYLQENNQLFSHGNTTAETSVNAMLGGIFTLPNHRGQGHAKTVVSALCHHLLAKNKTACLFYDNPNCKSLFESLGFKQINQWMVLGRK